LILFDIFGAETIQHDSNRIRLNGIKLQVLDHTLTTKWRPGSHLKLEMVRCVSRLDNIGVELLVLKVLCAEKCTFVERLTFIWLTRVFLLRNVSGSCGDESASPSVATTAAS
jgi:hypothetical protein